MKTDELLKLIKARGLQVALGDDGRPRLRGDQSQATPALLKVLRWHREEIIRRLKESASVAERRAGGPRGQE